MPALPAHMTAIAIRAPGGPDMLVPEQRPLPRPGDADDVAKSLAELSTAGLTGVAVSLINYADELPFFCDEVLPRLERAGIRERRS